MNTYIAWVCLQGRQVTTHIPINASNMLEAQLIAEATYGKECVLSVISA